MVVLVTGANGQLGQSLKFIVKKYPELQFVFCDSKMLNITNIEDCEKAFQKYQPNYCINTAAYTAVDKAESQSDAAFAINTIGVQNLATICKKYDTVLLHVSTDFVFDGKKNSHNEIQTPYTENETPNPTSVYGLTKLQGEQVLQKTWEKHVIIRTSWLYSQFGANFLKTMLRLAQERDSLSVVDDQIGTPTYAVDLAEVLIKIIRSKKLPSSIKNLPSKIFHFSNEGACSWYEFAAEIFKQAHSIIDLKPIPTSAYPTPAKRPAYSVLDKTKIKNTFDIEIVTWQDSLKRCVELL